MTSARGITPGSPGFPIRWLGRFAVAELPAGKSFLDATALVGELCVVLDAGAAGLIVYLPGPGAYDSAGLDALMRVARRARGWGSWLRLVIPDAGMRRVVRLVALDEVMPVHKSVAAAVAAAAMETAAVEPGGGLAMSRPPAVRCSGRVPGSTDGPDLLQVSVSVHVGYTLVTLDGEGDVTVRDRLRAALAPPAAAGTRYLVVDLSGLGFIDASCVQALGRASRIIQQRGGRVALAAPRPSVARVLELLDVSQMMEVHDSVAEAVIAADQQNRAGPGEYPTTAG